jgi:hypothetical protein
MPQDIPNQKHEIDGLRQPLRNRKALCPFGGETYAHDEGSHNKQEQIDGGTYSHSISEAYGPRKEVVEHDGMYYGTLKII